MNEGGWKMYVRFNMNMLLEGCYFGIRGFFFVGECMFGRCFFCIWDGILKRFYPGFGGYRTRTR